MWRDRLRVTLQDFGERRFGWPDGYRRLLFGDAFYESSVAFVRQARAFDSSSTLDDLWQAMRNVWIGNNLQMLLGVPVCLTQGLFAYSMLYPVTDNVLDALDRSSDDKRAFNDRFGQRLCGHHVLARDRSEASACALVSQIEEEFPRDRYADVWDSILAIHRGQVDSLRQQERRLAESVLCEISFAKGGASVLADLYLVAGNATIDQERFAFGYGVFLQLLDDLQDVTADRTQPARHALHARSRGRNRRRLDRALMNFIDVVLDQRGAAAGADTATASISFAEIATACWPQSYRRNQRCSAARFDGRSSASGQLSFPAMRRLAGARSNDSGQRRSAFKPAAASPRRSNSCSPTEWRRRRSQIHSYRSASMAAMRMARQGA